MTWSGIKGVYPSSNCMNSASVRSFLASSSSLRDIGWLDVGRDDAAAVAAAADDEDADGWLVGRPAVVDGMGSSLSCEPARGAAGVGVEAWVGVAAPERVPSRPRLKTYFERSSCVATPSTKARPGSVMKAKGWDWRKTWSSARPVSGVITVYVPATAVDEEDVDEPLENLVMMDATDLSLLPTLTCSSRRSF